MKSKLRTIIKGGCCGCWYNVPGVVCPRTGDYLKCVDRKVDTVDAYIFIPINRLFPVDEYEK